LLSLVHTRAGVTKTELCDDALLHRGAKHVISQDVVPLMPPGGYVLPRASVSYTVIDADGEAEERVRAICPNVSDQWLFLIRSRFCDCFCAACLLDCSSREGPDTQAVPQGERQERP
jgi:hypothetical protein